MTYNESQLNDLSNADLVSIYNELVPGSEVTKFKSKKVGVDRIIAVQNAAADPLEGEAVEADEDADEDIALPAGPKVTDVKARWPWLKKEAVDVAQCSNRKEIAIFEGANPKGLVEVYRGLVADEVFAEDDAVKFLSRFATIAKWPSVKDVKQAQEELRDRIAAAQS